MRLFVPDLIRRKRDGGSLAADEIRELIGSYTRGAIPDYQMSAMLMAVFYRGLDPDELAAWTDAMIRSGTVMDLGAIARCKVDKHSTGGVGDKISLCLAPAVAVNGVAVPMISGRGLGHTGGTLDKLESIPGFRVDLSLERAARLLADLDMFLIGQTDDLAPADRKLYALRDVTGTVESIGLISSSIMSKKLAEGIDALVLDVKVGEGAFMPDLASARMLAHTLIGIGEAAGKRVTALLTDMSRPIGAAVGNALEVAEAIEVMKGGGPADTVELTVALGAWMLILGGVETDEARARSAILAALRDGRALERFARVVEAQGGDPRVCDDPALLPTAARETEIEAPEAGFVAQIRPRIVARAAIEVGAGRRVIEDRIDPATGVELLVTVGDEVAAGQPLALLRHNGTGEGEAARLLASAFELSEDRVEPPPLIIERI